MFSSSIQHSSQCDGFSENDHTSTFQQRFHSGYHWVELFLIEIFQTSLVGKSIYCNTMMCFRANNGHYHHSQQTSTPTSHQVRKKSIIFGNRSFSKICRLTPRPTRISHRHLEERRWTSQAVIHGTGIEITETIEIIRLVLANFRKSNMR